MAELRPLRRIAIAAAWLLATYLAPGVARAEPVAPPEATSCAADHIDAARFRLGTAAGSLGASSVIADFNSDGRPDVAIADRTTRPGPSHRFRLQVVLAGLETVDLDIDSTEPALALSVADVDHDNDLDLVLSRPLSGETVGVWLNNGTGRFTSAPAGTFYRRARAFDTVRANDVPLVSQVAALAPRSVHGIVLRASGLLAAPARSSLVAASNEMIRRARFALTSRPRSPPSSLLLS